jgi:hypothetical protein
MSKVSKVIVGCKSDADIDETARSTAKVRKIGALNRPTIAIAHGRGSLTRCLFGMVASVEFGREALAAIL